MNHLQANLVQADTVAGALFYLFAGMCIVSAIGVMITRNIVRTAVWLLFALLGVAGLYFLLHSEFLAAVQLVIYAGGTLVLILFGVMLTSKSPFARFEPKLVEVMIALACAVLLLGALVVAFSRTRFPKPPVEKASDYPMGLLGQSLMGDYLVPFELVSVLLLVVMIGAAYLAKARRRDEGASIKAGDSNLSEKAKLWS